MAKKKQEGAIWFRMFRNIRNVVDAVPDESAGAALKAVFAYFDTGELPTNLDALGYALFLTIKPAVDESNEDYEKAVAAGRRAVSKRWRKEDTACIPLDTEEEIDKEKEIDEEIETEPPIRPLPKKLVTEMDFNTRREQALEKLRDYPA